MRDIKFLEVLRCVVQLKNNVSGGYLKNIKASVIGFLEAELFSYRCWTKK